MIIPFFSVSQNKIIGINYSFNKNQYTTFQSVLCDCSYEGEGSFDIGINYIKPISNRLSLMIDIQYSEQKILGISFWDGTDHFTNYRLKIWNFPLSLKYDFLKYFFINSGISFSKDVSDSRVSLDNQTGFGAQLGLGGQISIDNLYIAINPEIKVYTLVPLVDDILQYHAVESGIKFLAGYKF